MGLKVEVSAPSAEIQQDVSERTRKNKVAAELLVSGGKEG